MNKFRLFGTRFLVGMVAAVSGVAQATAPVCVDSPETLHAALAASVNNGTNDEIDVVAGIYNDDFAVSWGNAESLTLGFGYAPQCSSLSGDVVHMRSFAIDAPNATVVLNTLDSLQVDQTMTVSAATVDYPNTYSPSRHNAEFLSQGQIINGPAGGSLSLCSHSQSFCGVPVYTPSSGGGQTITAGNIDLVSPGTLYLNLASVSAPAMGPLTQVSLGGMPLPGGGTSEGATTLLPPGRHQLLRELQYEGQLIPFTQQVDVIPRVRLEAPRWVAEGQNFVVSAVLTGDAAEYPVQVPYTVSGTATSAVHDAVGGTLVIESGRSASVVIHTVNNSTLDPNRSIVFEMGEPSNAVAIGRPDATVMVSDANLAPRVSLTLKQDARSGFIATADGGTVTLSAQVSDPNVGDQHSYVWSVAGGAVDDTDGNVDAGFSFDPQGLAPGIYPVAVTVSDDGTPPASGRAMLLMQVLATAPQLTADDDSDGDGLDDLSEGFGDSDGDGIPDYLDAVEGAGIIHSDGYGYLQVNPGGRLGLGPRALQAGDAKPVLSEPQLQTLIGGDYLPDTHSNVGGVFDFVVDDLPVAGAVTQVVLPLDAAIPANAVYRKYYDGVGWRSFVEDANNGLASAPGGDGVCPEPGAASYQAGLVAGYRCVQLTLEDGGPNDADGVADGRIQDPGGVAESGSNASGGGGGGLGLGFLWGLFLIWLGRKPLRSRSAASFADR